MRSSYRKEDVELLLKDITGLVEPQSTQEREQLIQRGKHYCEMLPIEYTPTEVYMDVYRQGLEVFSKSVANAVGILADQIIKERGENVVLVSLARAGIPIGILVKRYLEWKFHIQVSHYSISIIRGRGIDQNAMNYILNRQQAKDLLFIDGWIGKGAILRELEMDLKAFPGVSAELAVIADPAGVTSLCGTHQDILIPSSCLNATVCGLVSRTFLRSDIIGEKDFHGAIYYKEWEQQDLSYAFIDRIAEEFQMENESDDVCLTHPGIEQVQEICREYQIEDINLVKPGIGETTRVLLRRVPWKILVRQDSSDDIALRHIIRLAQEKQVEVEYRPLENYKACGIIKKVADV